MFQPEQLPGLPLNRRLEPWEQLVLLPLERNKMSDHDQGYSVAIVASIITVFYTSLGTHRVAQQ
jgi:hypothetical protein